MAPGSLFTSKFGVETALFLGQVLPRPVLQRLGTRIADGIASRRNSPMVRAVRANQWMAHGRNLDSSKLDRAVRDVFRQSAINTVDLYHALSRPHELLELGPRTPGLDSLIERSQSGKTGAVVCISHSSNFDLILIAQGLRGLAGQVLTYAQPTSGYEVQNRIRASLDTKITATPISPHSLREALHRLRNGGIVYTGVDRPEDTSKMQLDFFGEPAWMPVGHVRLAVKAGVPIILVTCVREQDGRYRAWVSDPIPMKDCEDADRTIRENAQNVLNVLSEYISRAPEQWLMFYPVWPAALEQMP